MNLHSFFVFCFVLFLDNLGNGLLFIRIIYKACLVYSPLLSITWFRNGAQGWFYREMSIRWFPCWYLALNHHLRIACFYLLRRVKSAESLFAKFFRWTQGEGCLYCSFTIWTTRVYFLCLLNNNYSPNSKKIPYKKVYVVFSKGFSQQTPFLP